LIIVQLCNYLKNLSGLAKCEAKSSIETNRTLDTARLKRRF